MSSDIVERLRRITARPLGLVLDPPPHPLCKEAADAIETRDAEIERLRAEIKRLRAAGDEVVLTLGLWVQGVQSCRDAYAALDAWQEARRER